MPIKKSVVLGLAGLLGGLAGAFGVMMLPLEKPVAAKAAALPYRDRALAAAERVDDLMSRMTLEEKLILLSGKGYETRPIPRLGIPELAMTDGPNGVRWGKNATSFPVGIAQAATFDPPLVQALGRALAIETKAKARQVLLAPCVNISRVPQNGRNFECYGEDPFLSARTAVAYIKGVQGEGVVATVKHFACNNQEHRRMSIDVKVSKRAMHEIYFPAFKAAVQEAGVYTVMAAYNQVNGHFSTENAYLMEDTLKKRWGFTGFVMSDWDAVKSTLPPTQSGLDLEMPEGTFTNEKKLLPLIKSGELTIAQVDDKVRRILRVIFTTGVFDTPARDTPALVSGPQAKQTSLELARASLVLMKNDRNALPIEPGTVKSVLVVGPGAVYPRFGGGGSGSIRPIAATQPLAALKTALGDGVTVSYEPGYATPADVEDMPAAVFSHDDKGTWKPGLRAEYFNNPELSGKPALVRVEPGPDFHYGNDAPGPGVQADMFSSRLSGRLTPPAAGHYRFLGDANNGFRIVLDGKVLADGWNSSDLDRSAVELDLEARAYEIRFEHREAKGTAHLRVRWGTGTPNADAAVAAARKADAVVVFAGFSAFTERESEDHEIELGKVQDELIAKLARANRRTIVVLQAGSPVLIESWVGKVGALLQAWYPGQEGGVAIADALTGALNPSGRLPFTFLKAAKDAPAFKTYPEKDGGAPYDEGVFVGYRHYDAKKLAVRFPFGHGLSYARFAYKNLRVTPPSEGVKPVFEVAFDLTNTSKRAGAEVAQLYLGEVAPAVPRPPRELKGFEKVQLAPGERKRVTFRVTPADLAYFDEGKDDFVSKPGRFNVFVGGSSRALPLKGSIDYRP